MESSLRSLCFKCEETEIPGGPWLSEINQWFPGQAGNYQRDSNSTKQCGPFGSETGSHPEKNNSI